MSSYQIPALLDEVAPSAASINLALGPAHMSTLTRAAITEALLNAVVYGALGLPPGAQREPSEFLAQIRLAERAARPGAGVRVDVAAATDGSGDKVVTVADSGPGFDWRDPRFAAVPELDATTGRGFLIMRKAATIAWNDAGNELSLRFGAKCVARAPTTGARARLRAIAGAALARVSPALLSRSSAAHVDGAYTQLPPALTGRAARYRAGLTRTLVLARCEGARFLGPVLRRTLDIALGAGALAAASPILAVAAAAVKLTSPGPILIRQLRGGVGGRPFVMYKLRSMYIDAESRKKELEALNESKGGVTFKIREDPRITPVGRVIRRFSIDELPQLWNVVNGTMTILGPRPHPLPEVAKYDVRARRRLERKPGLTGLWQVSGRSDLSFEELVELDLRFIDTLTPLDEARIITRTVPAVISGKGAY